MKRGLELAGSGMSIAEEKECDQQTQNDLNDAVGECSTTPQDDYLRSGKQPGHLRQPYRTPLVQVLPLIADTPPNYTTAATRFRATGRSVSEGVPRCYY